MTCLCGHSHCDCIRNCSCDPYHCRCSVCFHLRQRPLLSLPMSRGRSWSLLISLSMNRGLTRSPLMSPPMKQGPFRKQSSSVKQRPFVAVRYIKRSGPVAVGNKTDEPKKHAEATLCHSSSIQSSPNATAKEHSVVDENKLKMKLLNHYRNKIFPTSSQFQKSVLISAARSLTLGTLIEESESSLSSLESSMISSNIQNIVPGSRTGIGASEIVRSPHHAADIPLNQDPEEKSSQIFDLQHYIAQQYKNAIMEALSYCSSCGRLTRSGGSNSNIEVISANRSLTLGTVIEESESSTISSNMQNGAPDSRTDTGALKTVRSPHRAADIPLNQDTEEKSSQIFNLQHYIAQQYKNAIMEALSYRSRGSSCDHLTRSGGSNSNIEVISATRSLTLGTIIEENESSTISSNIQNRVPDSRTATGASEVVRSRHHAADIPLNQDTEEKSSQISNLQLYITQQYKNSITEALSYRSSCDRLTRSGGSNSSIKVKSEDVKHLDENPRNHIWDDPSGTASDITISKKLCDESSLSEQLEAKSSSPLNFIENYLSEISRDELKEVSSPEHLERWPSPEDLEHSPSSEHTERGLQPRST